MQSSAQSDRPDHHVSDEALLKAEEFIEADEGAANKLKGWLKVFIVAVAVVIVGWTLEPPHKLNSDGIFMRHGSRRPGAVAADRGAPGERLSQALRSRSAHHRAWMDLSHQCLHGADRFIPVDRWRG